MLSIDDVPRALAARDTRGLIKFVADGATRKLLGTHILAPEGANSIQTAALAIRRSLTTDDLPWMIFPSDDRRRPQARGTDIRQRREEIVLLRRVTMMD